MNWSHIARVGIPSRTMLNEFDISLDQQSNNTSPILIGFLSALPSVKINAKFHNHNSAIQKNKLTIL